MLLLLMPGAQAVAKHEEAYHALAHRPGALSNISWRVFGVLHQRVGRCRGRASVRRAPASSRNSEAPRGPWGAA